MKKIPFQNIIVKKSKLNTHKILIKSDKFSFSFILELLFIAFFIIIIFIRNNYKIIKSYDNTPTKSKKIETNIDFNDEFFQIKEVQEKMRAKNLTYIQTLFSERTKVGNALITLNNLINICEKIRCKNIISPVALQCIIKRPIFYKNYNITIFPYLYKNKMNIDLELNSDTIFHFHYKNKPHETRIRIIREEVFNNLPKYNGKPNDLIIKIRSGDIFKNCINPTYSQPPFCFYQKIINENNYNKITILSNGHENPVVDELLKLYPKIKYMEGTIEEAISIIVNAYNLVLPKSTFPRTLIWLNDNLRNLYVYGWYNLRKSNYTLHRMKPSKKYIDTMQNKWKNTKAQLDFLMKEKCINNKFISSSFIKNKK